MSDMTCRMCEHKPCEVYRKAYLNAKDETDDYLIDNSCKHGCPQGYDKDSACYPFKLCSAKAHVAVKEWLIEHNNGY